MSEQLTTTAHIIQAAGVNATPQSWNHRVYINFSSALTGYKGDRAVKAFLHSNALYIKDDVSGTISSEFVADVQAVAEQALLMGVDVYSQTWGMICREMDTQKVDRI